MDGAAGVLLHLHGMRRQRRYAGARTEHRTGGGNLEVEELDGRGVRAGNEIAKIYADNKVDVIIYEIGRASCRERV